MFVILDDVPGAHVGDGRDDADGAAMDIAEPIGLQAGEHGETVTDGEYRLAHLVEVLGAVLERHHGIEGGDLRGHPRIQVDPRSRRIVVGHERQADLGNGLEMSHDLARRRQGIGRRQDHAAVQPHVLRRTCQVYGLAGADGRGAADHCHAPVGLLLGDLEKADLFLESERKPFTRAAGDDDAVYALFDEQVDEIAGLIFIERPVLGEGRHGGGKYAFPIRAKRRHLHFSLVLAPEGMGINSPGTSRQNPRLW